MIKAVVLDVDGVLKGSIEGINFPSPHKEVIKALKKVNKNIPVILCTGNSFISVSKLIKLADLNNFHISDRGALIFNPIENMILEKECIDEKIAREIVEDLVGLNFYTEIYSDKDYFIEKNKASDFTKKRTSVLEKEPLVVNSFLKEVPFENILKIEPFFDTEEEKQKIENILRKFEAYISMIWSGNPAIGTTQVAIITKKGIGKVNAMEKVLGKIKVSSENTLGVGDSLADWEFMQKCGYTATLENASKELKELVKTKENYFIAPHVDDNGILDIFKYFSLNQ